MSAQNNGGPAFPHPDYLASGWEGMSLRDYFAAHAPEPPETWHGGEMGVRDIIDWRWHFADAMLKAREQ